MLLTREMTAMSMPTAQEMLQPQGSQPQPYALAMRYRAYIIFL